MLPKEVIKQVQEANAEQIRKELAEKKDAERKKELPNRLSAILERLFNESGVEKIFTPYKLLGIVYHPDNPTYPLVLAEVNKQLGDSHRKLSQHLMQIWQDHEHRLQHQLIRQPSYGKVKMIKAIINDSRLPENVSNIDALLNIGAEDISLGDGKIIPGFSGMATVLGVSVKLALEIPATHNSNEAFLQKAIDIIFEMLPKPESDERD